MASQAQDATRDELPQHVCCCSASGDTNLISRPISAQSSGSTAADGSGVTDHKPHARAGNIWPLDLARDAVYAAQLHYRGRGSIPGLRPLVWSSGNVRPE